MRSSNAMLKISSETAFSVYPFDANIRCNGKDWAARKLYSWSAFLF